eukprot:TRINITY_DN691_c0_g1_i8.p1 TRINITY_DN691_c0_g1~~TRINITY_DN691_c0_g1_i8.p1  ORF type:complete len:492 (-),score=241.76 TRINITY_DN691_c0_g1_i8:175-1557(-)
MCIRDRSTWGQIPKNLKFKQIQISLLTMSLTLHSQLYGPRVCKIQTVAALAGVQLQHNVISDWSTLKSETFLKMNPNGKIPVLQTADGAIFESNAIVRFLARQNTSANLYGNGAYEQGVVDQWLDWTTTEVEPVTAALTYPILGHTEFDSAKRDRANIDITKVITVLENALKANGGNFLVGKQLTIADVVVASGLFNLYTLVWEEAQRKQYPTVTAWLTGLFNNATFKQVWGPVRFATKTFQVSAGQAQPAQPKPAAQPKAPAQPKPAEKPKKKEEEEEDEPKEKKDKNPLDSLPPTSFVLYDFKTLFVNAENKQDALDFLWKNYDPQGFSLYHVQYQKAEGEGVKLFLTNNLKNGFIQRLDHFRKYAFGVHGVYGEEPNLEIRGVWLWRGQGIPQEIKDLDSYDYHTWRQLDSNNEADKKLLGEYWTGLEEGKIVEGLRARDVSYFKQMLPFVLRSIFS